MAFALRVILALAPGDRLVFLVLAGLIAPLVLLGLFFSGPVVIHERVPMASAEQAGLYYDAAKSAGDFTKSPCDDGVTVNWQEVIAIDAVRLKQDFGKTSPERAGELARLFIEKIGE